MTGPCQPRCQTFMQGTNGGHGRADGLCDGLDVTGREAKQPGVKFFLRKPVDDRTLIDAIDWTINSSPDESMD